MLSIDTMYVSLPVRDIKEAMEFYGNVLNLRIVDENENGLWYQTGQSRIALYESKFAGTNKGTAIIWEVMDPTSTVKALKARGLKFEKYDDLPGMQRKGELHIYGSYIAAWFKDPSGNLICITHHL